MVNSDNPELAGLGSLIALLGTILVVFPAIRRLHDLNASGWWYLLSIVPLANLALGLTLLFVKGTEGENRYGADPLQTDETQKEHKPTNTGVSSAEEFDPDEHEKKCPMCAEYIKLEARVCRYCGHEFSAEEVKRQIEERRAKVKRKKEREQAPTSVERILSTHDFSNGSTCNDCGVSKSYAKNSEYECPS